jgi:hypothetical protein
LFIVNNAFMGRVFRGAYLLDSSTGATFTNNVLVGRMRAYETDSSSAPGFSAAANMQDQVFTPQPAGVSYGPLGLAAPTAANLETRLRPAANSRLLDAAVPSNQVPRDRFGVARPQPKRAGLPARPDVGPIERIG